MLDHNISRRNFLRGTAATAACLVVGIDLMTDKAFASETINMTLPNPWLRIDTDSIIFVLDKTEIGQGINTALAMIVAEELDVDLEQLTIENAMADRIYTKYTDLGAQMTGGSSSVRNSWEPLKKIAATARQMLIQAAAKEWNVDPSECRTASGIIYHDKTGKNGAYGTFAGVAAKLPVPAPKFKDPSTYRYVGKAIKRIDAHAKVTGKATYGIDSALPGMLSATIVRCPVFGGIVKSFDDRQAKSAPGVRHVINTGKSVAVLADTYWQARQAAKLLTITWDEGELADLSSEKIRQGFLQLAKKEGKVTREHGDVQNKDKVAAKTVEAVYETPYLAHATMEPQNCLAIVTADSCEVWAPTQTPGVCMEVVRGITGFSANKIKIHTTGIGGGFGRRLVADYVAEVVTLASEVKNVPVRVVWSREEDMQHDFYRPISYNVMSGGVDQGGKPLFWKHRIIGPAILAQFLPHAMGAMMPPWMPPSISKLMGKFTGYTFHGLKVDDTSTEGAKDIAYKIPNILVDYHYADPGIPVGFWRSVGHSHQAFMVESFIDELAHLAGKDPYLYRRELLAEHPRNLGVLDRVAKEINWSSPAPKGVFRGIAQHACFGSFCAEAVEASISESGEIKVLRVVAAIDCGPVVNPDGVKAQMEGAIIFGLSAALKGEITIENGRVKQSNFHDYEVLRINEAPKIEIHIMESPHPVTGVGEPGVPPIAPALANAIFAATGKRLRKLPLNLSNA
jgi:isoquinoline 1-oxidoreductase beta subunit